METRSANTFYDTLVILDILAGFPDGQTVGQCRKVVPGLSVGQVGRMLAVLMQCGFVFETLEPYGRTGKKVYRMTENAAIFLSSISRTYVEKQG